MAGKRKKKFEQFVRCFEVSDPTLHEKGHTIYKVTQKLIKVDAPDGDVQEIAVWRRYNDFNKLYKAMLQLHRSLHRREEFPPFARAKVFGRFDGVVLEERMRSAQDLLNFVGQRHYLVASQAFKQFFEGGRVIKHDIHKEVMRPFRLGELDKASKDSDSDSLTTSVEVTDRSKELSETMRDAEGEMLGGVWKYRQNADDISLNDDDDVDDDEDTDFTDDSALSTPLPSADVAFFDPLSAGSSVNENTEALAEYKDSWLLASLPTSDPELQSKPLSENGEDTQELKKLQDEFLSCSLDDAAQDMTDGLTSGSGDHIINQSDGTTHISPPGGQSQIQSQSQLDEFDPFKPRSRAGSGSAIACGKGDLSVSPVAGDIASLSPANQSPAHLPSSSPSHLSANNVGETPGGSSVKGSPSISPKQSPQKSKLLTLDLKEKADYIYQAAHQISLAQQCEVNGNYHMAFNYYKKAVGIMLTGVQLDENSTRRDIVRRKTAKYLMKAEELYHKYLSEQEESRNHRWDTGQPSPAKLLDARVAFLQGHVSELKNLKVLGVIGKVLLVMDTITDSTFVVKVLRKSCSETNGARINIIPTVSSYMVRLHKFFLTDSAIYLLLQHATGDRLWTYVSGYLHQQQLEPEAIFEDRQQDYTRTGPLTEVKKGQIVDQNKNSGAPGSVGSAECASSYVNLFTEQVNDLTKAVTLPAEPVTSPVSSQSVSVTSPVSSRSVSNSKDDTDFLSLDGSREIASFHKIPTDDATPRKTKPKISSTDDVYSPLSGGRGRHLSAGQPGFEDLLQRQKPSLENFSINSFDSDSGPGSRFESTSDYNIESIPEVSECSPTDSPVRDKSSMECSPIQEDVFSGDVNDTSDKKEDDIIQDAKDLVNDVNTLLIEDDTEGGNLLIGARTTDLSTFDSDVNLHSTPCKQTVDNCDDKTQVLAALESDLVAESSGDDLAEPSIYDQYKGAETDRSGDSSPDKSLARSPAADSNKSALVPTELFLNHTTQPSQAVTSDVIGQSVDQSDRLSQSKSPVFRLPSQERSLESPMKPPRKRTLSSVFGELDLAEDENKEVIRLPEVCVKQWAAELVVGISRLHAVDIICRDLRPANILLGERGHILLTYFSQWHQVEPQFNQDAIHQLYSAPEVNGVFGVEASCDWWSLGALLYELLTGKSLVSCHPSGITSHSQLCIPDFLTAEAQALLTGLLCYTPQERLGAGMSGLDDIKLHPFFSGIDWDSLSG